MDANLERGALLHKRYRIVDILGQGGMGSVYRAVDENLGVDVAVKENLFTTDEYARQFRLEAVILANLRHSNLPRVTDHFVIGDQGQYLIMDYIEGEDLRQRMERTGSISEEEAILVGAAMCDALEYLHTRQPAIIHRDLKPGNVRITPDGHIFLVDFGLAKLVKGSQATTTGARAMTPGYSPPEQYGTARTDPRTDIYSLGATLYASLSGVIPEDGLARAMDNIKLTPLRKRAPKVSRKLSNAIERAMAVKPADRFQSAGEFKQALLTSNIKTQRLDGPIYIEPVMPVDEPPPENSRLANEIPAPPLEAPPAPPSSSQPRKKARSTGRWVLFSVLVLIVLLLVATFSLWSPLARALLAPQPTATRVASTSTQPASGTQSQPMQASPIVASSTPARTITRTPTAFFIATRTSLPVYLPSDTPVPTETRGPTPTLLGGGANQIAFASDRSGAPQIYLMDTNGGEILQITNMAKGACQPSWSPDGNRLVFVSPCLKRQDQYLDGTLHVVNADGSGLTSLMPEIGGNFDPAWSPDGSQIAFTSIRDGSAQIYLLTLATNGVTGLTTVSSDVRQPDWSSQPAWSPTGTQILYTGHSRLTNTLQIWVMSNVGVGPTLLIHRGDLLWNFLSDWSPDGKTILFNETEGSQELGWLMLFDYENKTANAIHLRMQAYGTHADYSPDGQWVVYETKDTENPDRSDYDLYLIHADGSGAILRLTDDKSMEFNAVWRPIPGK